MVRLDSGHQICLLTSLEWVLTEVEGVCRWRFKNCEIGDVFGYISTTAARTAKLTAPFDSAHGICVSTISGEVLTAEEGVCRWRFNCCEIRRVFIYCGAASDDGGN